MLVEIFWQIYSYIIHFKLSSLVIFSKATETIIVNTNCRYLLKDQLKGPSSIEGFARTLKKGCRYIERKLTYCCGNETIQCSCVNMQPQVRYGSRTAS